MRYQYTFTFVDTEEEAKRVCAEINSRLTYYMRKHRPAHYTPWTSADGKNHKFVCLYYM